MTAASNHREKQHYVPKSYIKYWAKDEDPESNTHVALTRNNSRVFPMLPCNIAIERGIYCLGKSTPIGELLGEDYLEKGLFAGKLETALTKNMHYFRPPAFSANKADTENMAFLALHLWARNPIAIDIAMEAFKQPDTPETPPKYAFKTRGDFVLAWLPTIIRTMDAGLDMHLYSTTGKRFETSDMPCSMWAKKNGKFRCVKSLSDTLGATEVTYLFPINPGCLLQFAPIGDQKSIVSKHLLSENAVDVFNERIKETANHFRILGHWH